MYKTILFTHNDLDGAGCRIIFELAFAYVPNDKWEVVICSNNNVNDKVTEHISGRTSDDLIIMFADICCSQETLKLLRDMFGNRVMVFDHHLTNMFAVDILGDNAHIIHTNNDGQMESGTSLLFKYFRGDASYHGDAAYHEYYDDTFHLIGMVFERLSILIEIDKLVYMIRSYDTYEWKSTNNINAKYIQTLFELLGMESFCHYYTRLFINADHSDESKIDIPLNRPIDIISDEQMVFINARLEKEQAFIDQFTPDDVISTGIMGCSVALFVGNVYANISELAHQFLSKYTEYDIFILASLRDGGVFEIRTIRDDINTGELIAKPIGGGGHPKASGAPIDKIIMRSFREALIAQLNQKLVEGDDYY